MDKNFIEWSRGKVSGQILDFARSMRRNPTSTENILWQSLRDRKLNGLKFRRQQHLEGFIVGFYCDQSKLAVEVDGDIHNSNEQKQFDQLRTEFLEEFGIKVIRFSNDQVLNNIDQVLNTIRETSTEGENELNPSPRPRSSDTPLPGERGRGEGLKFFRFDSLLQKEGWISPAFIKADDRGIIQSISSHQPEGEIEYVDGFALPGFQNAHSHAFQYAMAGLAENHPSGTDDDFWTWREEMYKCALAVDPDQVEAIAAILYAEMLRVGYTHVAEFHYLHHGKDGKPYDNLAEMGERLVAAAKFAGIKITLVPVFYQKGNFGQDPQPRQRRFISKTVDEYFKLLDASKNVLKNYSNSSLGFCVHSLRAVDLNDIKTTFHRGPKELPFHLHVSEQKKEVNDCLAFCNKRPMQWLLENLPVNERFHLVHSTHLDDDELNQLATSKANVVLCPSTEGNLGDGIFRMKEYVKRHGHWSIGTDSHIGLNPLEEFRMIDYRQRLITNHRNTFEGDAAAYLVNESVSSGKKAMGFSSTNNFEIGKPFDAVVFNSKSHLLAETSEKNRLATILYTSDSSRITGTIVNGKWIVKNGHHNQGRSIKDNFTKSIKELKNR